MTDFSNQRDKTSKLVKKVGSHAVNFQSASTKHVTKYVKNRVGRISGVRRFVTGWLLLVVLLCIATLATVIQLQRLSQTSAPTDGGTYTEGLVGAVNNLNPLFSSGSMDNSASMLIFNGMLRHDTNGALTGDLASSWRVEDTSKSYIVDLKRNVRWHDGQPFTSADVVYTIGAIQNPATRSSLFASWQGVKVAAINDYQLRFELPAPFAPFPNALTVPILPKHLLGDVPYEKLRTSSFNTQPVGTGPFVFAALRSDQGKQQLLETKQNTDYYRGTPRLDRFVLHSYPDDESLAKALKDREITAAVDLKTDTVVGFNKDKSIRPAEIPLNSGVFGFFKTNNSILSDTNVRQALAAAVDRQAILKLFKYQYASLKTPLLSSQLGYDAAYSQQTNIADAAAKLDAAGWVKQANGMRAKDGVPLELGLTTANSAQYSALAAELQKQWGAIGVVIKPQLLTSEQLQQNALTAHSYDILLYGISIGYDPDVYAYWNSSQARQSGLNFSEWKSSRADSSLEVARTRLEPVLRSARYKTFLDEWQKTAPAVALYQPRVSYAYHQNATGFVAFPVTNASERLTNVEAWTVNTRQVKKTP